MYQFRPRQRPDLIPGAADFSRSIRILNKSRFRATRPAGRGRATPTAEQSLQRGFAVLVNNPEDAVPLINRLAPEHLQVCTADPESLVPRLQNYGGLFLGSRSAEGFGDYGVGPNHVLPTSGAARRSAGLSVMTFLRQPTWLQMEDGSMLSSVIDDTAALAELEGLHWHARAARASVAPELTRSS